MVFLKPHFAWKQDLQDQQLTALLLPQPQACAGNSKLIFYLSNYSNQPEQHCWVNTGKP